MSRWLSLAIAVAIVVSCSALRHAVPVVKKLAKEAPEVVTEGTAKYMGEELPPQLIQSIPTRSPIAPLAPVPTKPTPTPTLTPVPPTQTPTPTPFPVPEVKENGVEKQIDPADALGYLVRGHAYRDLGQYQRAIQSYDKAIQLNPDFRLAYLNRGFVYSGLGQYQRAIEDYDKAIHLDPDNAAAYVDRGLALENLGQINLAKEDHKQACKLDRKFC